MFPDSEKSSEVQDFVQVIRHTGLDAAARATIRYNLLEGCRVEISEIRFLL
jgi:hypothetical protein